MYRNTVGLIMGETVLVVVMKKLKDDGITDHGLVWNTDLFETLELETHINLAEHEMYSAVTLAERLRAALRLRRFLLMWMSLWSLLIVVYPLMWMSLRSLLIVVYPIVANTAPQHWGHC